VRLLLRVLFSLIAYWIIGSISVAVAYNLFVVNTRGGAAIGVSGFIIFFGTCLLILAQNLTMLSKRFWLRLSIPIWVLATLTPFYFFSGSPRRAFLHAVFFIISAAITVFVFDRKILQTA
jgi:hypothetical protein